MKPGTNIESSPGAPVFINAIHCLPKKRGKYTNAKIQAQLKSMTKLVQFLLIQISTLELSVF